MESKKKIIDDLAFLQTTADATYSYMSNIEQGQIQKFCFGMIKRLGDTASSTKLLFENLEENPNLEFSIGIMFRAVILDALISMNLYKVIKQMQIAHESNAVIEQEVLKFCNIYLADGLNKTIRYFEDASKYLNLTEEDVKKKKIDFIKLYSIYFSENNSGKVKFDQVKGGKELFKQLAMDDNFKEISKIYDCYMFFSKYDHFGILGLEISENKLNEKLHYYRNMCEILIGHNAFVHIVLDCYCRDEIVKKQKEISNAYLLQDIKEIS
jgi:hypothetical protein